MTGDLQLALLGKPEIRRDGISIPGLNSAKAQALLCYLAVTGRSHFRTSLAGLLWGDMPETNARTNLRRELSVLRRTVGEHLTISRQEVAFNREAAYRLDVEAFEVAASQGSIQALQEAVDLYRGDFLDGFYVRDAPAFEEWVLVQRTRLRELALQALHKLSAHYAEQGEPGLKGGITYTSRLLALEPSREEAHQQLMLLLAQSGQRGAALAQYDACRHALAEDLGVEPGPETVELYERIRDGEIGRRSAPEPLSDRSSISETVPGATSVIRHNLPPQPTPFIGREAELAELDELIADRDMRLITIVGPGGIGKTRLALAAAERQLNHPSDPRPITFAHGVCFVPLVSVSSAVHIVPALARALDFHLSGEDDSLPERQVLDYLREKQLLLVLDNLEHLLDGADIIARILQKAPRLQILATSRERLRLQQEQVFAVQGLAFWEWDTIEEAATTPAARLFLQSARRVQRDFGLNADELPHLYRICQMTQGMPLALELAAGWVDNLSLADIVTEMQGSLDLLVTEWRDVPERHRSLRAAIDSSWTRLTAAQQDVFCQLSVFQGGFTRAAAREVAGADLRTLATLANKSLIQFSRHEERYGIHELLRQYGSERLVADPESEAAARDRHSAFYCAALGALPDAIYQRGEGKPPIDVKADWVNVRAAWEAAARDGHVSRLDQATDGLWLWVWYAAVYEEGEAFFALASDGLMGKVRPLSADGQRVLAKALLMRSWCYALMDRTEIARAQIRRSKSLLEDPALAEQDTRPERALLHKLMGWAAQPNWETARKHYEQALALERELGRKEQQAYILRDISWANAYLGERKKAIESIEESLALFRDVGSQLGTASALHWLGNLHRSVRDYDEANAAYKEALSLAPAVGFLPFKPETQEDLGWSIVLQGDFQTGVPYLRASVAGWRNVGSQKGLSQALSRLCSAQRLCGDFDAAYASVDESMAVAQDSGIAWLVRYASMRFAELDVAAGRYDQARTHAQKVAAGSASPGERVLSSLAKVAAREALGWVALAEADYGGAVEVFQQGADTVVTNATEAESQEPRARSLAGLGRAAYGLGNHKGARRHLLEALEITVNFRAFINLLHVMPIIPVVLGDEDDLGLKVRAAELHGLCMSQPFLARAQLFEDIAWRHIRAATASLPPDVVAAAQERGRELDWWITAEALLQELDW